MFLKDLAYAVRTLRNSPVFAITAIVTIALGIGASTAIFSVTSAVLLRPLPYKNPDRLVLACADMRKRDVKDFPLSNAEYFDLRDGAKSTFEEFGAVRTGRNILPREDGTPEQVRFAQVTTNFFRLMGARIQFGRDFEDADGQPPPPPPPVAAPNAQPQQPPPAIAILSYEYFQRRYGGNKAMLGRRMLNGGAGGPLVVGVLAPRFELLFPPDASMEQAPEVWTAARLAYDAANRNNVSLRVIGRLKNGVTLERAQAEADAFSAFERKQDAISATVVRQRTSEIGVRMALGAAPAGIFNLVVGHGLRLSAAGIVIGLAAALSLTRVMSSMLVGIKATDPPTFAAMAVLFLIIAAAASWLPACRAASLDPTEALREE